MRNIDINDAYNDYGKISVFFSNGSTNTITIDGIKESDLSPFEIVSLYNNATMSNFKLSLKEYTYTNIYRGSRIEIKTIGLDEFKEKMNSFNDDPKIFKEDCLRKISSNISDEVITSEEFKNFLIKMREILEESNGVGLAAPQIGVDINVFMINIPDESKEFQIDCEAFSHTFINPTYTINDLSLQSGIEGCLSLPGFLGVVRRPKSINVKSYDYNGDFSGYNARVFMHEFDHLRGTLYGDKSEEFNVKYNIIEKIQEARYNKHKSLLEYYGLLR